MAALVAYFVSERSSTYAAASGLVLAASLLSSVVQPLFGALTDRRNMPWLLPVSTVVGGAGVALAGVGGSYALSLAAVALSGIGVAACHPQAARTAHAASRGSHAAMGWFSLGGNLGFAAAPFAVAAVVATGGLRASPLLIVPALAGAVLCLAALRPVAEPGPPAAGSANRLRLTDDWRSFSRLSGAVVCRSAVFVGLSTFIAVYVRERTAGGELAGPAALFLRAVLAAHHPGQDYLPGRAGTAAGVTLGLAVSVGGIASPVIGALADATSLRTALVPLIALPRSAHSCCAAARARDHRRRDGVAAAASAVMTWADGGP
ncbi:MFS transporter [Streptomyces sp. 5K101]|uniref:MFS transporter n=1 Tax=Streptomyces sp. 5K101 TaxID=3390037 RepID=UPI0039763718